MRGIKAAILIGAFAWLAGTLLAIGREIHALWPLYKLWHFGAGLACLYVVCDLADRWREFLGTRSRTSRPRRWYGGRYG